MQYVMVSLWNVIRLKNPMSYKAHKSFLLPPYPLSKGVRGDLLDAGHRSARIKGCAPVL